jgi:hypothetical protein
MSGDHTSVHSFTAAGISNFFSLPEQTEAYKLSRKVIPKLSQMASISDNLHFITKLKYIAYIQCYHTTLTFFYYSIME